MVTIKDIANVCNVSYSTVSRVLNGKTVRPSTRNEKIVATAKALGYNPNNIAVQLVKRSTNLLGLLIPDVANPHYSEITKCVEDTALAAGYKIFLCNTDWDVRKEVMYRDALLEQRVAGMIVMPVCDSSHAIFRGLSVPVVLLGSRTEDTELNYVVMDNCAAAAMATEHLIARGFTGPVFIRRKLMNVTATDRVEGFRRTMLAHGLPFDANNLATSESHWMDGGYNAAKQLLSRRTPPDSIIAFNDFMAFGALQAIEEQGLTVGKDVALIGFDNILFSSLHNLNLTTITPENRSLAIKAVEIISKRVKQPQSGRISEVLPPHLVVRGTCGEQAL